MVRWLEIKAETVFADGTGAGSHAATAHGRAVRMSGVATDITDRKRREADLALLDQIADSYARLSSPEEIMQVVGPLLGSYLDVPTVCLLSVDEPTRPVPHDAHVEPGGHTKQAWMSSASRTS